MQTERGVTLIEILAASLIGALLAGGSLIAFTASALMTRESVTMVEASDYAVQTIEAYRNRIACDDVWFDASCNLLPQAWAPDAPAFPAGQSALQPFFFDRQYQVVPLDCDGVGGTGDCYQVDVRLRWVPVQ